MNNTAITVEISFNEKGTATKITRRFITEGTKKEAKEFEKDLARFIRQHGVWNEKAKDLDNTILSSLTKIMNGEIEEWRELGLSEKEAKQMIKEDAKLKDNK